MKGLGLKILLIIMFKMVICFSQNEANLWHFGNHAGFDFSSGQPELILNPMSPSFYSTSTMSDANGNFLFTTNGESIWNRNNQIMFNGDEIRGDKLSGQGTLIVQCPGSDSLFYVFTTAFVHLSPIDVLGLYYSVVDISLDNGLGGVTSEKNVLLTDAWDAAEKIVACRKENSDDIWVITRKFVEDGFAAFLLTDQGINPTAVFSQAIDRPYHDVWGNMKISPNKKHLVAAYPLPNYGFEEGEYEVCNFNSQTGEIDLLYTIRRGPPFQSDEPIGVEFSPDSKYLYLSLFDEGTDHLTKFFQFDMQYYQDSLQFVQSKIHIATGPCNGLQLARDGKIYLTDHDWIYHDKVSVINKPWKHGTDCEYVEGAVDLEGATTGHFLPNMLLDYYYRFEWEGRCQSETFVFQPNFIPDPEYIVWNFGDPVSGSGNVSYELHPVHYFSGAGEFEVSVYLRYPGGRVEQTSRVVTVKEAPQPDLGEDTLVCQAQDVTLNAGDGEGFYLWSNGSFGENANEITVSDTGTYWVRVENEDCVGYDTIYIGLHAAAEINEDNLSVVPTGCNGEVGKILGLAVNGTDPLSYSWYDADDNLIGSTLDITGLGVGNYFLHIMDGNSCTTISEAYTIIDAGDITISEVEKEDTHCEQDLGSIVVTANSGSTGELLYSIDNGNNWQTADNSFEDLFSGNYFVRVKDQSDCEGVYENNPVIVESINGPEVISVTTQPDIDYLSNGEIDISVNGFGDLFYSIDNGNSFQTNNGLFTNLSAGLYTCIVKDNFGCDTTFTIEVKLIISQLIEAIAGDGYACMGNATVVPLKLNNFVDIFKFNLKLTYDTAILNCDGFIQVHPLLEDNILVSIVPNTDVVVVNWQGDVPTSLEENATLLELVFGAKDEGFSTIDWAVLSGESVFYNEQLDEVNADYHVGSLRIYTRPEIFIPDDRQVCEGEFLFMMPFVSGGTGEVSYFWEGPNGFESTGSFVEFENITQSQEGIYNLRVTDTINCVETEQINVSVYDNPAVGFPPTDTIYEQPGFVLDAGEGYPNYLWNTGDTTNSIEIDLEGLYSVLITSGQDCKSTDSVTVLWGQSAFYLPNAFTPNGDGLNDEFKPVQKYDFVNSYHLSIFSRWGEMIFETSDINQGWDGSYKGNPSQQGAYIYKIVFTAWPNKEEQKVVTGSFTLVR